MNDTDCDHPVVVAVKDWDCIVVTRPGRQAFVQAMTVKVVVVLGALVFAAACQPPGSSSSCSAQIDWVNFIQVGSTQYVARHNRLPSFK